MVITENKIIKKILQNILSFIRSQVMTVSLVSLVLNAFMVGTFAGLFPMSMSPVAVEIFATDSSLQEIFVTVPEVSGLLIDDQMMAPHGYDITTLVNTLKHEHNICLDIENKNVEEIVVKRRHEPHEAISTVDAIFYAPETPNPYIPSYVTPESYVLQVKPAFVPTYSVVEGYGEFTIPLNTVECQ